MIALRGMATYHTERKELSKAIECCEEGLMLLPDSEGGMELGERPLLLLANAAEKQGDMRRARECDDKAKKI